MSEDWNAEVYHRVSEPQRRWGERVLASLELRGDELVLDAGCGTGRLTRLLIERLPNGRVVALDASASMLEKARAELAELGDRVSFVRADLGRDALPSGVEVVFSTATFHWVLDHDALLSSIGRCLVPGGRLHAQCGGAGNLERALRIIERVSSAEPFSEHLSGAPDAFFFAGIADTERRLSVAGFVDLDVTLEQAPTTFGSKESYAEFVRVVVLRNHLARLPQALRSAFVETVTEQAAQATPALTLDYVRLNLRARRAG